MKDRSSGPSGYSSSRTSSFGSRYGVGNDALAETSLGLPASGFPLRTAFAVFLASSESARPSTA